MDDKQCTAAERNRVQAEDDEAAAAAGPLNMQPAFHLPYQLSPAILGFANPCIEPAKNINTEQLIKDRIQ
jgi:hypothetical protein